MTSLQEMQSSGNWQPSFYKPHIFAPLCNGFYWNNEYLYSFAIFSEQCCFDFISQHQVPHILFAWNIVQTWHFPWEWNLIFSWAHSWKHHKQLKSMIFKTLNCFHTTILYLHRLGKNVPWNFALSLSFPFTVWRNVFIN